ncbi:MULTISPECIES: ABC transporter substrate-binding protein [Tenacibaculum]|uniref:ABC transporter substrate-binding protein n=1 Tax=Tenacibaculum TaxID=104267 RepID=UPI000899E445|nr:ABC transporter substrate-binding protein [Tenacibaculum sp. MAR_2010_89]SEE42343.1 iron complex transport system substrate-binding protein [Tenacibaculum sp. MAR_2010_89]
MIVSSFMPAVTQMIYDMGLQNYLNGITFECPKIALKEKEVAVRYKLEGKELTSKEITDIFSRTKAEGGTLYYVDEPILKSISPDLIFTQDVCDVCQIDTESVAKSAYKLAKHPKLVSITPNSLEDVFNNALTIAREMNQESIGINYVNGLKERIYNIVDIQRIHKIQSKSVLLLEWIDPLFNCGHWIPHQIGYAGGVDLLSHPSGDSIVISWDKIVKYNPEVLIIAPCGYGIKRTLEDMKFLEDKKEWNTLRAVKNKKVYIADFAMFTQSSASTLVDGIECLAQMIHPNHYTIADELKVKFSNYYS